MNRRTSIIIEPDLEQECRNIGAMQQPPVGWQTVLKKLARSEIKRNRKSKKRG